MAVAHRTVMPLLLNGTVTAFCWIGLGGVCAGGSESPGDASAWLLLICFFPDWDYPAATSPAQPHCSSHGCPQAQGQPRAVVQTKATLLLRTSFSVGTAFKTESRGYTGFILMRLHICFSGDVSHWKLNLQSSGLSHPSSPLTSGAPKLFCQSSNTFVSILPSRQVASQKHSQKAARGRICSCISVRYARSEIARNCVVILTNGDHSVVSFSPRRENS